MRLVEDFIRVMQICLNTGIYICWLDKIFVFSMFFILFVLHADFFDWDP